MRCFERLVLATLVACTLFFAADSARAVPLTISGFAAMGASETQGTAYSGSWVPYLAVDRGINFGPGQSYNKAVGGSTSSSLLTLNGGQHNAVKQIVEAGNANFASIFVGGLDVPPALQQIFLGTLTPQAWANGVVSRITTAVDTVLDAGADGMLVWGIPDMSLVPSAQSYGLTQEQMQPIVDMIALANDQLKAMALARDLVFIDTAQAMQDMNAAPLVIGGVTINTTQGNPNPRYFFQDGLHPAVVGNGVFANMAIAALDIGYGQSIAPFSDQVLLQKAGLGSSYTGETSTLPYANYVYYNVVPEPATIVLFGGGLLGVAVVGHRRAKRRASAVQRAA